MSLKENLNSADGDEGFGQLSDGAGEEERHDEANVVEQRNDEEDLRSTPMMPMRLGLRSGAPRSIGQNDWKKAGRTLSAVRALPPST